ncbi:unnamed protein product [Moneuplotes crassus]|uniref:Uncharacterized protein n=1 Tax=Euplotes crassus TaxID=5936 RepID=A0AAD1XMT4_EUPCR|nr:unnamed protein product [Moneuplotes crassus]
MGCGICTPKKPQVEEPKIMNVTKPKRNSIRDDSRGRFGGVTVGVPVGKNQDDIPFRTQDPNQREIYVNNYRSSNNSDRRGSYSGTELIRSEGSQYQAVHSVLSGQSRRYSQEVNPEKTGAGIPISKKSFKSKRWSRDSGYSRGRGTGSRRVQHSMPLSSDSVNSESEESSLSESNYPTSNNQRNAPYAPVDQNESFRGQTSERRSRRSKIGSPTGTVMNESF